MKMKNKFVVTGLIAGLAIFSSTFSYAAQACHEREGSLQIVTVNSGITQVVSSADIAELYKYNLVDLNRSAAKACSGGIFCIEDSTIKHEATSHNDRFVAYMNLKTTALVNCLK